MVGPLKTLSRDPEGRGRGPGRYYRRVIDGEPRWSKYDPIRDLKKTASARTRKLYKRPSHAHKHDSHVTRRGKVRGWI